MLDVNKKHPSVSAVSSVKFHPAGQIALVASLDSSVRIFQVDGKNNAKVQGIVLRDLPPHSADFTADGKEVICTGKRRYFYSYNLESGHVHRVNHVRGNQDKDNCHMVVSPDNQLLAFLASQGFIHLVSRSTLQSVGVLRMNGEVKAAQFSADGSSLFTVGSEGEIYQWDMKTRRCARLWDDAGSLRSSALAVAPNGQYLATGAQNGIVNIFDIRTTLSESPTCLKSIMNFTTPISQLQFNHDAQILAVSSRELTAGSSSTPALKLFHFPSITAFSNWPNTRSNLQRLTSLDFSPHSGFLAIGNRNGRALLYRLAHYPSS